MSVRVPLPFELYMKLRDRNQQKEELNEELSAHGDGDSPNRVDQIRQNNAQRAFGMDRF
jgi:hypothetical protein